MNDEAISVLSASGPKLRLPIQTAPIRRQLLSSSALCGTAGVEQSAWLDDFMKVNTIFRPIANPPGW
jgi:hypothetical protein